MSRIVPVILAGGRGTRLWPLSRDATPKQFLHLTGDSSLLQATVTRVPEGERFGRMIVIVGADQFETARRQIGETGAAARFIVEPGPRNTAPAIALAVAAADPESLLLVLPSDHAIRDPAAFQAALSAGAALAEDGWLVTFGATPDSPETGYGYIRLGDPLGDQARAVAQFIEKPDRERAEMLVASGDYVWNAGIFLFRADRMAEALREHAPDVMAAATAALSAGETDDSVARPDAGLFAPAPSISIDHAVMEKAGRIAVVPVEMGWSDLGSWDALHAAAAPDAAGNVVSGNALAIDSRNCLVRAAARQVIAIGIEDLVVVETADAVLIMPRGQSDRMREVARLGEVMPDAAITGNVAD